MMSQMNILTMRMMKKKIRGEPAIGEANALSSTGHQKVSVHPLLSSTLKQSNQILLHKESNCFIHPLLLARILGCQDLMCCCENFTNWSSSSNLKVFPDRYNSTPTQQYNSCQEISAFTLWPWLCTASHMQLINFVRFYVSESYYFNVRGWAPTSRLDGSVRKTASNINYLSFTLTSG